MTAGTLLIMRHGRTAFNAEGRFQGQTDIPLDDVGQWQAEQAAKALAGLHCVTAVVSSDLSRALATAQMCAESTGVDVVTDPRLRERSFGSWDGLTTAEIGERWPDELAAWRAGVEPRRAGAETKASAVQRMLAAIDDACAGLSAHEAVLVVSHGSVINAAVTALLGLDPSTWRGLAVLSNCHWSQLGLMGAQRTGIAADAVGGVAHGVSAASGAAAAVHASTTDRAGGGARVVTGAAAGAVKPAWRLLAHNVGAGFPTVQWNAGPDWKFEPESA